MKKLQLTSLIAVIIALFAISQANAAAPNDLIKNSNKKIQDIIKSGAGQRANQEKIKGILESITDFNKIAEDVTSAQCRSLKPEQCKRFKSVFTELIKYSTAKKLSKYKADKIDYQKEEISGNHCTVKTVVYAKDKKANINYQMEKINNKWLITNYIVDDINTTGNYKKQFARLFKTKSFDQVISNLEQKVNNLKSGKGE